jgi:hypothetical protein
MKKRILLFTAVMALFAFNSVAQRMVDTETTLITPVNGAIITDKSPFQITFSVKNAGPDTIKAQDSLLIGLTLDGSTIGGTTQLLIFNNSLLPDSSITLNYPSSFSLNFGAQAHGSRTFCAFATVFNRSADSIVDGNNTNNLGCASVTLQGGDPASIGEINDMVASEITTYPNPASNNVNVSFRLEKSEPVVIKLTNIQGKVVSTVNESNAALGEFKTNFDVSDLKNGVYFIEIKVGNHSKVEKIIVAH